jgi:hypothetical protein
VHPVHVEDTRRDDVSQVEYQGSEHLIENQRFTFAKRTPTMAYPSGMWVMTAADVNGNRVQVEFGYEGYELLKAIMREY